MIKSLRIVFQTLLLLSLAATASAAVINDDAGARHEFAAPPSRVVSLVPSATEIICAIEAQGSLAGRTYEDTYFEGLIGLPVIGGTDTPNFDLINALEPDLLIVTPAMLAKARAGRGSKGYPLWVWDDQAGLAAADAKIGWLGAVFGKREEAGKVREENQKLLETLDLKARNIPAKDRRRVMRLMAEHGELFIPGSESFQTELIAAAGGLPPRPGRETTPLTLEKWLEFNPQVVFGCGRDKKVMEEFLARPEWAEVEAVKNKRVLYYPCALTDRAAAHTGHFASWLSTGIYGDLYGRTDALVHPQEIIGERPVALDVPYVARARVVETRLMDFVHRALLIDFKSPQTIISTTDGPKDGVETIGNSFSPSPTWNIQHQGGWEEARAELLRVLNLKEETSSLLFTGADMNNLSVKTAAYEDITITALVTAGAEGNAIRTSRDIGAYYKPGTINIIVLSSRKLSPAGAARALITITEAKTAALWDMDIRSTQTPRLNPATGTGTDDIIVVAAGDGEAVDYTGGHAKIGELIADAVYHAVQEALKKQNGKAPARSIFERFGERGISVHEIPAGPDFPKDYDNFQFDLEALLLSERYRQFIEAAFSLDDALNMGQLSGRESFDLWSLAVASEIAGKRVGQIEEVVAGDELPPLLTAALNALATGLKSR